MPIHRFDAEMSNHVEALNTDTEKLAEFRNWIDQETGVGFDAMSPHEVYYVRRAYESKNEEERVEIAKFLLHYELTGCAALVAAEYHPEIGKSLIGKFGKSHTEAGGGFYEFEKTKVGVEFNHMLNEFSRLFYSIEDLASAVKESDMEGDKEALSEQFFEALIRKGSDLIKLFSMIQAGDQNAAEFSIEDVNTAMLAYSKTLMLLRNFFTPGLREGGVYAFEKYPEKTGQSPKYAVRDKLSGYTSDMKWFVRPQAGKDGQARISVEIGFDSKNADPVMRDLFKQKTTRLKDGEPIKEETNSTFRLSIDRDTTDQGRPVVSMDIGRAQFSGTTFVRTGDKFGNMLACVSSEANHTPFSFDPKFAEPETFSAIALKFGQYISGPQPIEFQTEHQK